ncbi:diacylglycerol/polyprenol kinase family protein [Synechococcus sp. CS-1327]|uniref:diacylglycerol/polyprenol kinase family protein n=1 Tax=Synechococcus sp. CS-1327 TaxID=2847977 RepID=UPI00223B426F|nr:dolichol kinase [Synechococcus sp. CS-1327]MCT0213146.1 dolichol kinase [Synechococcus sp. CS-1326]MCT0233034.1 dolichol kinase [Synechococcus sp. CS-1327]
MSGWGGLSGASQQAAGVAAVALWLGLLLLAAFWLRRRWPGQREWSRKLVHIGTGPVVVIAWIVGIDRPIAVGAAALTTAIAALNHRIRLLPAIEDVGRASYGTIAYGAAITVLLILFWPRHPDAVAAGVLVMALGDGLAGVLGAAIPSPSWQIWGQRKSLLGTATMGLVGWIVLVSLQAATGEAAGLAPGGLVGVALVATALEQLAVFGLDNLTVPIVTGLLWRLLSTQA